MSAPDPSLPDEIMREAREWCSAHDPSEENIARLVLARDERAARIAREHDGDGSETNVGHVIARDITTYTKEG